MSINRIREQLKNLRMPGAGVKLDLRLSEARCNSLEHGDFLELLLQDELLHRAGNKIRSALKAAGFRNLKPLADFDWQFNPNLERKLFYELAGGEFIRQAQNILMVGPSGTGKTCLAQAIGFEAIKLGFTVIYRSIFDIVSHLQRFNALSDRNPEFERYLKADLLIIDDMGLKQLPEKAGELLFEIIFRRHELKSTIMTSNRPLDDWGKLIGDVPTAGAILDRFLQQARLIPFKGKSFRPPFGRQGQARLTANDALLDAAAAARLDHAEGGSL